MIIPVPLHKQRLRERGFNQAVLWGAAVSAKYRIPMKLNAVLRSRWTAPQVNLHGSRRENNVRNAFSVGETSCLHNASVLLVDDVYTTGATMKECARALRKGGAARIDGFVIARTV